MATYKTRIATELWATGSGSKTGIKLPVGTILEVGKQIWLKDGTLDCRIIVLRLDGIAYPEYYLGKCVEFAALESYAPPPPTEPPTQDVLYSRANDVTVVMRDAAGNVVSTRKNDNEIRWLRHNGT
jgi:hypothetical protein